MENENAELIAAINEITTVCKDISGQLLRAIDLLTELLNRRTNSDEAEGTVFSPGELTSVKGKDGRGSVGVIVMFRGKILTGKRVESGEIGGPGGHIEPGETPKQAALRETEEEFGITPKGMISIGTGAAEPDTGLEPVIFLCADYDGEIKCTDGEMCDPKFMSLAEIESGKNFFKPFSDGVKLLCEVIDE